MQQTTFWKKSEIHKNNVLLGDPYIGWEKKLQTCVLSAAHPGNLWKTLHGEFFRHFMRCKQEPNGGTICADAAAGQPKVRCLMPCNAPLYKRMWRLFSFISACTQRYLIFFFLSSSSALILFSWIMFLFFTRSALAVYRQSRFRAFPSWMFKENSNISFFGDHGMSKHFSIMA